MKYGNVDGSFQVGNVYSIAGKGVIYVLCRTAHYITVTGTIDGRKKVCRDGLFHNAEYFMVSDADVRTDGKKSIVYFCIANGHEPTSNRDFVLSVLYMIRGFYGLPLNEKNKAYDAMMQILKSDMPEEKKHIEMMEYADLIRQNIETR